MEYDSPGIRLSIVVNGTRVFTVPVRVPEIYTDVHLYTTHPRSDPNFTKIKLFELETPFNPLEDFPKLKQSQKESPCPSNRCWTYDDTQNNCILSSDCGFELECAFDKIKFNFPIELFGGYDLENFIENNEECKPIYNDEHQILEWSAGLGECGQTLSTEEMDLKFEMNFGLKMHTHIDLN